MASARQIIETLGLAPHPEGGWFRETWRAAAPEGGRAAGTAIYYLLEEGQVSRWHRVDAAEIWHWYLGAPLEMALSEDGRARREAVLGPELGLGERPQVIVPAGAWQSARPRKDRRLPDFTGPDFTGPDFTGPGFTLAGCTVSPAFEFEGFELAPEGWEPGA